MYVCRISLLYISVRHRFQLDSNRAHYYPYSNTHQTSSQSHTYHTHPPNTSNVGMPCGCGHIFNDIYRFFSFSLLPTYLPYSIIRFARETTGMALLGNGSVSSQVVKNICVVLLSQAQCGHTEPLAEYSTRPANLHALGMVIHAFHAFHASTHACRIYHAY